MAIAFPIGCVTVMRICKRFVGEGLGDCPQPGDGRKSNTK